MEYSNQNKVTKICLLQCSKQTCLLQCLTKIPLIDMPEDFKFESQMVQR